MCTQRSINHHAQLVARMAETLGLDLTAEMEEGRLSSETWRDAVIACAGCSEARDCVHWLADQRPTGALVPPVYCENAGLFDSLRPVTAGAAPGKG